ncbi:hypothetical protein Q7A53_15210 [Halobacillus rhizosphaerae]|uniref:hypothetical protein n=1 Tax=Halobacillus rhizosphaerae TaxID=3064889 RepID=UPI00398B0154
MFYLAFALLFTCYLIAGYFTSLDISTVAATLSVALILVNLYMFVKERNNKKKS